MFRPKYREKKTHVPILSHNEINDIAEKYVCDFQPDTAWGREPLDVEAFIECYLGMTQDYQYLSHNGIYLGMTVFNETDKLPVYNPTTKKAEYAHADANTVIIDRWLYDDEKQHHRYRFTLGHEGGHAIFHTRHFYRDPNQLSFFENDDIPAIRCRRDSYTRNGSSPRDWTTSETFEWQANAFASALLMPATAVREQFNRFESSRRSMQIISAVQSIVDVFDVSQTAAVYRLRDLKMIACEETERYLPSSAYSDFSEFFI